MVSIYIILKYVGFNTLLCASIALNILEYVFTNVDKLIWNFISDDKPDKLKRDVDPLYVGSRKWLAALGCRIIKTYNMCCSNIAILSKYMNTW